MAIPKRGWTSQSTYFITADTFQKKRCLQSERMARLLVDTLYHYRQQGKYLLHEFVVMPNHIHLLITPQQITIERAMQFIKGGFSYKAGRDYGIRAEIWQTSFHDWRVRDWKQYLRFREYIHNNPVAARLAAQSDQHPYSSAAGTYKLDDAPQRLKPASLAAKDAGLKPCSAPSQG